METTTRRKIEDLNVPEKFCRTDFYRLLDLLHKVYPDKPILGEGGDPELEVARLRSHMTWGHKASSLHKIDCTHDQPEVFVNFLGLAGAYGPLPDAYGELIADALRNKQQGLQDFLDIFNHRLLSLLYQNYRRGSIHSGSPDPKKNYAGYILHCLTGLVYFEDVYHFEDRGVYPFHDLLWTAQRSATGLLKLLEGYCKVPVTIRQFLGNWLFSDASALTLLAKQHHSLGRDTILGHKIWDHVYGVEITLGSLSWERYFYFIPPKQSGYLVLKDLCRYHVGAEHKIRLTLKLDPHASRPLVLGEENYLSYTTWLTANPKNPVGEYAVSLWITVC